MNSLSYTMKNNVAKFKLVFLGDQGVGKTSIINRFIYDTFQGTHQPTIGIDFISKCMKVDNRTIRLQLWDTAGQERFRSLIPSYIRDSSVVVLCFDVLSNNSIMIALDEQSFQGLSKWLEYVKDERGDEVTTVLVANKVDMDSERAVKREDAEKYAKQNELYYFEVSAKEGTNIQNFFKQIAQLLVGDSNTEQDSQVQPGKQFFFDIQERPPETINLKPEKTKTAPAERSCAC